MACQRWSIVSLLLAYTGLSQAWVSPLAKSFAGSRTVLHAAATKHGENACFLPLKQLDQDYYPPRTIQIAGVYPGVTKAELQSTTCEPSPDPGQWSYEFIDPEGPQVGTIAIDGSSGVHYCEDPAVLIGDHFTLGVILPDVLTEPVDIVMVIDKSLNYFSERKFLVMAVPGKDELEVAAFNTREEMPVGAEVLGQVILSQIPWLPCMKPTRTGFMEVDEYF